MTNNRRFSIVIATALALVCGVSRVWARSPNGVGSRATSKLPRERARAFIKMDVRLDSAARGLYVGQAVPVTIRAYFLGGTGVAMNGQPRLTSDAFVLSDLSEKPHQSPTQARGLPYTSLTWTGSLTAVKAGVTKTDIELPVSLSYREEPRLRSVSGMGQLGQSDDQDDQNAADPFASLLKQSGLASDPLFSQMFNGHDPFRGMFADLTGSVRQREVTLHDQSATLRVLDPPPGAPPGFTGAVGTFEISSTLAKEPFRVGEPATLKLNVSGQGSFSRLSVTGVAATDDLNTYGVTSTFTPGPRPAAGEKVFTQTIAPRHAGTLTVPALTLTYLDPHERKYVTRRTNPMSITVAASGSDTNPTSSSTTAPATAESSPGNQMVRPTAAIASVPDVVRATLIPSFRTRWFWWLAGAIGLGAVVLTILGRTYRNGAMGRVVAARRVREEVELQSRTIAAAAVRGDAVTLFGAARKALQARLGARWGIPSEAIAAADVASRLGPSGERIHEVFERADRLTYSGGSSAPKEDLSYWQGLVSDELRALEGMT
jgi:hypothetical protein